MTVRSAPLLFSVSQAARGAVQWWLAELAALIPAALKRIFSARERRVVADLVGEDLVFSELAPAGRRVGGTLAMADSLVPVLRPRMVRALRLPASEAIFRRLALPLVPEVKLRPLLLHEIERQTPFLAAQVLFDYRILRQDRESRRIEIELAVLPRETVDRALEKARQRGFAPSVVSLVDGPADRPHLNFLAPEQNSPARRQRPLLALSAAALFLAVLAILGAVHRHDMAQQKLAADIAEAKQNAAAAQRLQTEIAGLRDRGQFLATRQQEPRLVEILDALTKLLPSDTWIFEFQMNGRDGHIIGYSPAASKLIGAFANSKLFANPRFRAPLTQVPNGHGERFDLGFEVRETMP